jgi:hypothetical protein
VVSGFLKGAKEAEGASHSPFEAGLLPDDEKERLCRSLLAEFGVTQIQPGRRGELVHACCLPHGRHKSGDSNPSASLNYLKLTYNCLGCGNSGGLLWFIAECRGTSATEASGWLASETGTDGTVQDLSALMEFFDSLYGKTAEVLPPIPKLDPSVLEPWLLIHPYMTEHRLIPVDNLKQFRVGYGTFRVKIGEDRWVDSERIVIPHFWKGDLTGWQSRRLYKSDGTSRWKNSADFPKDITIYNYVERRASIVVESPMNVLRHAHHLTTMESTFGAAVTDRQVRLLSRHPEVVLWFDNDLAGWDATEAVGEALEPYCKVRVVDSPYAADAADMPDQLAAELVGTSIPFSLWNRPGDPEALIPKSEIPEEVSG